MVLPRAPLFLSAVSFALLFTTSALSALPALHNECSPPSSAWTAVVGLFVVVPTALVYRAIYTYNCVPASVPPRAARTWRPCKPAHQALVFAAYAFFSALGSTLLFALATASLFSNALAVTTYASTAPLALVLFVTSWTPFPALIRRLPHDAYYLVENATVVA